MIFFNKSKEDDQVQLIDASKLGTKVKENGNQRTVLSQEDIDKIVKTAVEKKDVDDFSITVSLKDVKDKNYSFSAGQYFPVKIEYVELTQDEFDKKMEDYQKNLDSLFSQGNTLGKDIQKMVSSLKFENKN